VRAEQFARGRGFCGAFARRVVLRLRNAPVAQLDRAAASEAVGQKFESSRAHHTHFSAKERFQLAEKTIVIRVQNSFLGVVFSPAPEGIFCLLLVETYDRPCRGSSGALSSFPSKEHFQLAEKAIVIRVKIGPGEEPRGGAPEPRSGFSSGHCWVQDGQDDRGPGSSTDEKSGVASGAAGEFSVSTKSLAKQGIVQTL
jgi:hypothetical protein